MPSRSTYSSTDAVMTDLADWSDAARDPLDGSDDRVRRLIQDAAGLGETHEPLPSDMLLHGDLGIESLQLALLMFRFEDEFGIDLVAAGVDIGVIRTVGDVLRTAKELLESSARPMRTNGQRTELRRY
jgi:acyl carrier protein